jgi:hypothetical protein
MPIDWIPPDSAAQVHNLQPTVQTWHANLPVGGAGYDQFDWTLKIDNDLSGITSQFYARQFQIERATHAYPPGGGYLGVQTTDRGRPWKVVMMSIWETTSATRGAGPSEADHPATATQFVEDGTGWQVAIAFDWQAGEQLALRIVADGVGGFTGYVKGDAHGGIWYTVGTSRYSSFLKLSNWSACWNEMYEGPANTATQCTDFGHSIAHWSGFKANCTQDLVDRSIALPVAGPDECQAYIIESGSWPSTIAFETRSGA